MGFCGLIQGKKDCYTEHLTTGLVRYSDHEKVSFRLSNGKISLDNCIINIKLSKLDFPFDQFSDFSGSQMFTVRIRIHSAFVILHLPMSWFKQVIFNNKIVWKHDAPTKTKRREIQEFKKR
jgi:hypothetical protein